jgi:hypothetical protein
MVKQRKTTLEKYQQKAEQLAADITKGEELIEKTKETMKEKKKELEQLELLITKELLIKNNMSVQDLAALLNTEGS